MRDTCLKIGISVLKGENNVSLKELGLPEHVIPSDWYELELSVSTAFVCFPSESDIILIHHLSETELFGHTMMHR